MQMENLIATIKTFRGGQDIEKEARNQSDSGGMIRRQQHHNQEEPAGFNKGHMNIYNETLPKVELSAFHVDNPRGWIRKCRKFFKLHFIPVHQ